MNTDSSTKLIIDYYSKFEEQNRLKSAYGQLEFAHMTEILERYFPKSPAKICDIGGAAGDYAIHFAEKGYDVHLLDIVPLHIEQAKKNVLGNKNINADNFIVGDALNLPYEDNSFDAVFLGGPLYHLPERKDRIKALREARRVLKPNGIMTAYGIGRYATMFYGIDSGKIFEDTFMEQLKTEVSTGYRHKYENNHAVLDNAFFHLSEELKQEVLDAGLNFIALHGVIGNGWMVPNFDEAWKTEHLRNSILEIARMSENIPNSCSKIFIAAKK